MQSPDGNHLWCPGQSLWSLITEHVTGSELQKIHAALGKPLIDMYTDMHFEAEKQYKMWQVSQHGNNSSRARAPLPHQQGSPLADPPVVKELVRGEVKMLLQTLKERVGRGGRDGEELVFQYKPETVDYALSHLDSSYSTCTNPEDTDDGSRPRSHCSVQSNTADEIEAMRDKLNVTDIDQVVDSLRSILVEECEALKMLVKNLKGSIKKKWQRTPYKAEPSLAELKELRGAIQTDLELFPSSLAASPQPPSKDVKNSLRLSKGQNVSEKSLQALRTTSAQRPHSPPPLCHSKPRPPLSAPPTRTSASVQLINGSSLSRTHGQHRSISASTGHRRIQTPTSTSGHANNHFTPSLPGPGSDLILVKTTHQHSLSLQQDSAGLHYRTQACSPAFQIKTPGISPIQETHLLSHRSVHSTSRKCNLSPQTEGKSSPAWRSRNINTITSVVPPPSPYCDEGSYSRNRPENSVSTTGKSQTQNSTSGGSLVSTTDNDRKKSTCESFHSCFGSKKNNNAIDRNTNGLLGKDVTQSLVAMV